MTRVIVDSGICGFTTIIEVVKTAKRKVNIVVDSPCEQVAHLAEILGEIDQRELFKPHCDSEIYKSAENCKLHLTCPVPTGILKAIEVETGLAIPCDASVRFEIA